MNLDILYEDNHIIVCYKPVGILSQADSSSDLDMLSIIKEYIKNKYNKPGNVFLGLVHRLDRNTSGIMVFAKTSKAASRLSLSIKENNFNKEYLAIVEGSLEKSDEFIRLENKLKKDESLNKSFVSNDSDSKEAILDYIVLDNYNNMSLIKVKLITGRHHQIRCQLSNIGHPIYGDVKYGSKNKIGNRYNLQAYLLSFIHPTTKELKIFKHISYDNEFKYFEDIKI